MAHQMDDRIKKRTLYEPPRLLDLGGDVAHAAAPCAVGGSPAVGKCQSGFTAAGGQCHEGQVATGGKCQSGGAAAGKCKTGATPA